MKSLYAAVIPVNSVKPCPSFPNMYITVCSSPPYIAPESLSRMQLLSVDKEKVSHKMEYQM